LLANGDLGVAEVRLDAIDQCLQRVVLDRMTFAAADSAVTRAVLAAL
jgi:hypothetical protein